VWAAQKKKKKREEISVLVEVKAVDEMNLKWPTKTRRNANTMCFLMRSIPEKHNCEKRYFFWPGKSLKREQPFRQSMIEDKLLDTLRARNWQTTRWSRFGEFFYDSPLDLSLLPASQRSLPTVLAFTSRVHFPTLLDSSAVHRNSATMAWQWLLLSWHSGQTYQGGFSLKLLWGSWMFLNVLWLYITNILGDDEHFSVEILIYGFNFTADPDLDMINK
jgi:hypothetical protein